MSGPKDGSSVSKETFLAIVKQPSPRPFPIIFSIVCLSRTFLVLKYLIQGIICMNNSTSLSEETKEDYSQIT